jgi:hypothetical protein
LVEAEADLIDQGERTFGAVTIGAGPERLVLDELTASNRPTADERHPELGALKRTLEIAFTKIFRRQR